MVIGGTVGPVSSVGRAPDLQAGGRGFESCIGHTFSSLVYFNGDEDGKRDAETFLVIMAGPFQGGESFLHFPLTLAVSSRYTRSPSS